MVGTNNSGRPGGNPNIANVKKTGPKTPEGKLKVLLKNGLLKNGRDSKIMNLMSKCNHCPLRPRREIIKIGNKEIERVVPAQCRFYEKDKTECAYPVHEQIQRIKSHWEIEEKLGTLELQKSLILDSIVDAEMSRKVETLSSGHAKFYTKEHREQALKYLNELNKIQHGNIQKHQHLHVGEDIADKMVDALFKNKKDNGDGEQDGKTEEKSQ